MRQLLAWLMEAGHECWADGYVVEEARRNLATKAPGSLAVLETLLARVSMAAAQAHPVSLRETLAIPEKDRPVLAAAIRLACDVLVTGDRTHFGAFMARRSAA